MSEYFEFKFKEGKGGEAMLTYYHFCVVIFDYYKKLHARCISGHGKETLFLPLAHRFWSVEHCYK